jgi:predicted secreted protein
MTDAASGWGGEFHLNNGTTLTELVEVVSFTLPNSVTETMDASHLKSPGRKREYISGMTDDGDITVTVNYIAGNTTDTLVRAAKAAGTKRDFMAVVPRAQGVNWEIEGSCIVTGWDRGEIVGDGVLRGVITLKISGDQTEAAAS